MHVSKIVDRARLAAFMQNNAALNAYPLGDLDEPYWQDSEFFALEENGEILKFSLLYLGIKIPILIVIENNSAANLAHLLSEIKGNFPDKLYAHMSLSQRKALLEDFSASSHGVHHIMELKKHSSLSALASDRVIRLDHQDFEKILALFELGYPGH